MQLHSSRARWFLASLIACLFLLVSTYSFAAAPDRITGPVASGQITKLPGGVPLNAQSQYDQGPVDPSLKLGYMTLLTAPSASQQKAIRQLLAQQQNPRSPQYHKWLTPEQYADRFGLSPNDVKKITTWLQSQGFTVVRTARGRNWIVFSGTAAQVERAFQVQIHNYDVKGEKHFANTTPPSIPAALSGIVTGFRGLSNFLPKSYVHRSKPGYTFPFGGNTYYFLAPGDVATMYDINALYSAGIDGTGETLAVMGQTDVYLNDLAYFRSGFGLSPINCTTNANNVITACNTSNFQYVYIDAIADPGAPNTIGDDLPEADIDLEWSGATARNAQIIYVNAPDPNGGGVWDSWYYAVDNTVAPVITLSYGLCELAEAYNAGTGEFTFGSDEAELQMANSEGITFMNSSADQGAASCDYGQNYAYNGYAVSYPASSPEVTSVGGTLIPYNEYTATYWSTTNGTDGGSAKSYIPEQPWNDAQEWGIFCGVPGNCNGYPFSDWASAQSYFGIWASGGGVSNCVSIDVNGVCQSGFPQPSWQAGLNASAINPGGFGVTTTPARFSPDVSLMASIFWPGYLLCTAADEVGGTGTTSSCSPGGAQGIINDQTIYGYSWGGTSVGAPIFAGIVTLLNQYLGSSGGLGNINATLYSLAATPSNGAFHSAVATNPSLTAGSDGAYCQAGSPANQPAALQCPSSGADAGFLGFDASNFDPTTGYDLLTGLGSVDANNLAVDFAALVPDFALAVTATPNATVAGTDVVWNGTLTALNGYANTVNLTCTAGAPATCNINPSSLTPTAGGAAFTVTVDDTTAGTYNFSIQGTDGTLTHSQAVSLTVNPDFTVTNTGVTSQTVLAGVPATGYGFTVAPVAPATTFGGAVTFSCSFSPTDPTLTNSSCVFNPPSIAAGAGSTPVTLSITTSGPNPPPVKAQQHRRADNRSPWLPLTLPIAGVVMVGLAGRKVSRRSAIAGACLTLALLGVLIACGSSANVTVGVSPSSASLWPNDAADGWPSSTQAFTATVGGTKNSAVTWSITPSTAGSIDANGNYTAPTIVAGLPASVTVTATSQADSTKSGNATVTLKPATVPGVFNVTVTATEAATPPTTHALSPVLAMTVQ